jgi:16S rRNA (cytosine967-C5)-methyltransferase
MTIAAYSVARDLAARVLVRVWDDGAFAAPALDAELGRASDLDARDAGLCTELVYGVLRTEAVLEQRVLAAARRGELNLSSPARAHLFIGVYSLLFLDRVPAFAAVSEAVAGVAAHDERAGGFANAVLRRLAAPEPAVPGARAERRLTLQEASAASAPGWLRGALRRSIGRRDAEAYLAAGPVPPPIGLCLRAGEDRDAWLARLREAAPSAEVEPGAASPRAILVRGAGDVRRLPGAFTAWIVQEEGSQLLALAAGARPGERVLDACAGHGNKSWILSDDVGEAGTVDATDLSTMKLACATSGRSTGPRTATRCRATTTARWSTRRAPAPARCAGDRRSPCAAPPTTCRVLRRCRWPSCAASPATCATAGA